MKLSSNMEDYLEAFSLCADKNGVARITDVSIMLGVRNPSVVGMVRTLVKAGYLKHEPYKGVEMTAKGRRAADDVKKRHAILSRFLIEIIGVTPKTADLDACKMEHTVSRETLEKLHEYLFKITGKNK